jgi:predicted enzyme related to lactoylglutathione lyase
LKDSIDRIGAHGGKVVVDPVEVDGYHFAMFEDPECNLIGIIEPFGDGSSGTPQRED